MKCCALSLTKTKKNTVRHTRKWVISYLSDPNKRKSVTKRKRGRTGFLDRMINIRVSEHRKVGIVQTKNIE